MKKQLIENPELKALANITLDAATMFSPEIVDNTLAIIKEKALDFEADITTKKGQDVYRSKAMMVRKIKTLWVGYGEGINREEKKSITVRNVELKKIKEFLDEVAVEVREALTAQEAIEEQAKAKESMIIKDLLYYYSVASDLPVETFQNLIEQIKAIEITGDILSDFFIRATQSKESSLASLEKKLADRIQHNKDQAELAKLRADREEREKKEAAEKAEQDQKDREEQIHKEAEAKAKKEAAEKLAKEKDAKKKAIQDKKDAEAKAKQDKIDAEVRAKREKEEAVEVAQENARAEAEQKEKDRLAKIEKERLADEKRAANKKHRAKIEKEVLTVLSGVGGINKDQAKSVIDAISAGIIPHTTISY